MAKKKSKVKKSSKSKPIAFKGAPAWFTNTKLHLAVISIFCFIIYSNTLSFDYALDDAIVITENEYTQKGIAGIGEIFANDTFRGFFKEEGKANLVTGGRYRPLTQAMFAIEKSIFGKDTDVKKGEDDGYAMWGHLFNILWYAATCCMIYLLFLRIFKNEKANGFGYFIALATALLFAAHPVHTECVANIKGRDEIIALLGSLATAYLILKSWQEKNQSLVYIAAAVFFVTFFSKENTVTFLGVIPLMLYVYTKAGAEDIARKVVPLIIAFIGFFIIRSSILESNLFETPMEMMNNPFVKLEGGQHVKFSPAEKFSTIMFTLGRYIELLFVPYPLTHDYYPRHIGIMNFSNWKVILSIITHIALLIYGLKASFEKKTIGFGILYYLGTLFIVSNFIFPVGTNMAERFLFMPSLGFCLIIAVVLYKLSTVLAKTDQVFEFKKLTPSLMSLGLICLIFGAMTFVRNPVWKDNLTLFTEDAKISVNSAKLQNAAGGVLIDTYQNEKNESLRTEKINQAVVHLKQALEIHPNYKNAYLLLGNAHNYLSKYEEAITYYNRALNLDPNYNEAKNNIAITYRDAGRYYGEKQNNMSKSLEYLRKAEEANPNDFETLRLLGVASGMSGQSQTAISYFERCTKLQPNNAGAWLNLGNAYGQAGDIQKAEQFRAKAAQIDPAVLNRN